MYSGNQADIMKKIITLMRVYFQQLIEYRSDMFIYTTTAFMLPLVLMAVWLAVADSGSKNVNKEYIIQYFYWQMLISVLVGAWHGPFLGRNIREGTISMHLLHPFQYIWYEITENIGEKLIKLSFALPTFFVIGYTLKEFIHVPQLFMLPVFFLSVFQAASIQFLIQHIIGISAFWLSEVGPLDSYNDIVYYLTSGKLFPLVYVTRLIPPFILSLLPYKYIISLPIEVLLTKELSIAIISEIFFQTAWVLILIVSYQVLWQKGLRKYGGYGG